jgi:hypothetical protein
VQAEQNNLQATNMLMMNIQFNQLLKDEEAECGVSSTEDLEAEEDDGTTSWG